MRNGFVVVDKDNKIAGMLRSLHLIKWIVPDYMEDDKHLAGFEASDVAIAFHHVRLQKPLERCETDNNFIFHWAFYTSDSSGKRPRDQITG